MNPRSDPDIAVNLAEEHFSRFYDALHLLFREIVGELRLNMLRFMVLDKESKVYSCSLDDVGELAAKVQKIQNYYIGDLQKGAGKNDEHSLKGALKQININDEVAMKVVEQINLLCIEFMKRAKNDFKVIFQNINPKNYAWSEREKKNNHKFNQAIQASFKRLSEKINSVVTSAIPSKLTVSIPQSPVIGFLKSTVSPPTSPLSGKLPAESPKLPSPPASPKSPFFKVSPISKHRKIGFSEEKTPHSPRKK